MTDCNYAVHVDIDVSIRLHDIVHVHVGVQTCIEVAIGIVFLLTLEDGGSA